LNLFNKYISISEDLDIQVIKVQDQVVELFLVTLEDKEESTNVERTNKSNKNAKHTTKGKVIFVNI